MTDFRVGLRIDGDSTSGERALNNIDQATDRAGQSAREMGQNHRRAGTDTQRMGQSAGRAARDTDRLRRSEDQAAAAARALAAANARAAASSRGVGGANGVAAGSLSNLTAQFNDLGVMLAAGQNPLMLALQQGTQITQVIGPMGAAGAVSALSGAFMSLLNPLSLATIGTIAGVAAFSNWARSAGDAGEVTMTFEEHLQAVGDATERYLDFSEQAAASTSELEDRFGSASGAVRSTLQLLERLAASEAQAAIDGIAGSLSDMLAVSGDGDRRMAAADFFDVNIGLAFTDVQREARKEARLLTSEFINQRSELAASTGNIDGQITALEKLIATTERLADANGNRSAQEEDMLQQMAEALLVMYEQRGAVEDAASAAQTAYQQYYDSRIRAEEVLANMRDRELTEQAEIYQQFARLRSLSDQEARSAMDLIADLEAQNTLKAAILMHGEKSAEVAAIQAEQETAALETMLATLDVSEELKDQLRQAHEHARAIANVDMESGIRASAEVTRELAEALGVSYREALKLRQLGTGGPVGPDAVIAQQQEDRALTGVVATVSTGPNSRPDRSRSGGASAAIKERDAVADLITSLEQELAVQRGLDPVQREMIRHRETLAAASDAERERVEELIATRAREAEAMELARENLAEWKDLTNGLLDELISSGGDLESVLNILTGMLLQMIQQAALLGEGPLAGLFGTAGGGGAIGGFFDALAGGGSLPAKAEGGRIYGPGGGTSDDVLMWGSSGETMMNARATRRYGPLLDAMNGDAVIPGFSSGGTIGGGSTAPATFGGVNISIENRGSTPITGNIEERPDGKGGRKFALVLADQVGTALTTKGGGAKRALEQGYGVRPRGSRR